MFIIRGTVTQECDPMHHDDPFLSNDIIKRVDTQDSLVESLVRWNNLGRRINAIEVMRVSEPTAEMKVV